LQQDNGSQAVTNLPSFPTRQIGFQQNLLSDAGREPLVKKHDRHRHRLPQLFGEGFHLPLHFALLSIGSSGQTDDDLRDPQLGR
jgi:hypothetical protein